MFFHGILGQQLELLQLRSTYSFSTYSFEQQFRGPRDSLPSFQKTERNIH